MDAEYADRRSWSDAARATSDIKGRADFARMVSAQIDRCEPGQDSTVFGIVGPWGSGKTTLLREVEQFLQGWTVVWFSPWSASTVDSITEEYLSTLAEAYPKDSTIKDRLARYARFGSPTLKAVPMFGDALAEIAGAQAKAILERKPWHKEFAEISKLIAATNDRVLVIVDDVDRLDVDELRSLLRVVRLLGRFANVHYLLAYDQETIEGGLAGIGGRGYMDKIVQYPFEVPPPPRVVKQGWAELIISLLESTSQEKPARYLEDRKRLLALLVVGLETPRASGRLREQVASMAPLVNNAEVDPLDFIALTWLRITHHDVWDHIRRNADLYLSWEIDEGGVSPAFLGRLLALVEPEHVAVVDGFVRYLFEPEDNWSRFDPGGRRASIKFGRYFERYFHVGLAEDDVSETMLREAVAHMLGGSGSESSVAELRRLLTGGEQDRSVLGFVVLREIRGEAEGTSTQLLEFVHAVRDEIANVTLSSSGLINDADNWLSWEVSRAVVCELTTPEQLISRFGFTTVFSSVHLARRVREADKDDILAAYNKYLALWIERINGETLMDVVTRREFITVIGYCVWAASPPEYQGFLGRMVSDGNDLLEAAAAFVVYREWVGSDIEYEAFFSLDEFTYAIGEAKIRALLTVVDPPLGVAPYQTSDLSERSLTRPQVRDFAFRKMSEHFGSG